MKMSIIYIKRYIVFFLLLFICITIPAFNIQRNKENRKLSKQHQELYDGLLQETQSHIQYLSSIGLAERAKGIIFSIFKEDKIIPSNSSLYSFTKRTAIPQEIYDFDPYLKNTIITTDPDVLVNKPKDVQKILDIRLYPTLRNLIKQNRVEIFLGGDKEMVAYYKQQNSKILFKFKIPSSATYYLAESKEGDLFIIMAGLVSRENIIAQLLTFKLAEIELGTIEIIGQINHFDILVDEDINCLSSKIPTLKKGNHILIIAGCGLANMVSEITEKELQGQLGKPISFKGDIISLVYTPFLKPINSIHGTISLNLNYGEITEKITHSFIKNFQCMHIFTGGAGGYIPQNKNEKYPDIGTYIPIVQSMNEQGEVVWLEDPVVKSERMHLQIPSIFLETYEWLEKKRKIGSSVDVETFYIMRAIQNYKKQNPDVNIKANCGYFVSDYVGEQPLREYSKVYLDYPKILANFLWSILKNQHLCFTS